VTEAPARERASARSPGRHDGASEGDREAAKEQRKSGERLRLQRESARHGSAERPCMDEGLQFLDLARNAQRLFERQEPRQRHRLLKFLLSNRCWADGEMTATFPSTL
jgi:hypothetical protein